MFRHEGTTKNKVLIFLAPEFNESETVYCLEEFRKASLPVCLVSMSTGLVKGKHGLLIRPDYSLDELLPEQPIRLILIPGGQLCSASIMSDPRAHRLINATIHSRNFVAAMSGAESILSEAGFTTNQANEFVVSQGLQGIKEFAQLLINLSSKPVETKTG